MDVEDGAETLFGGGWMKRNLNHKGHEVNHQDRLKHCGFYLVLFVPIVVKGFGGLDVK